MMSLRKQRLSVRHLLDQGLPDDAMISYYALHHDQARTQLFLHYGEDKRPDSFLVRAQTGADLFRPLVTLTEMSEDVATCLFESGLIPFRQYYAVLPYSLRDTALRTLEIEDEQVLCVYRLDSTRYQPLINVLVTAHHSADGLPRREIHSQDRIQAMAGVNWISPRFAEIYVSVEPAVRGRGWGRSVVSALVGDLCAAGLEPLYIVSRDNESSINLAEAVGFVDTGARKFAGYVSWSGVLDQ